MHKLIDNRGRVLFVSREQEAIAVMAGRYPLPMPAPAPESLLRRAACLVALALLMITLLVVFLLFGEFDKPGDVQPATTMPPPHQPSTDLPWLQQA
ncbi:MAG: hypothetical protein ACRYFV_01740 [Janthinobacterium lividum]